jgi:hypothetical protein
METDQIPDDQTNLRETVEYVIEQSIEKLTERSNFTPAGLQAQFIAMLIGTFDSSLEGFEDCTGPATMTAIRRAIEGDHPLIQFLAELATFEYVRSPPIRYQNLLLTIFKELASQDLRPDENPLRDFVRGLPYVPESAFD